MKLAKLTIILFFAIAIGVSAQEKPYPNELEGYKFFGKGKLSDLKLGVSSIDDVSKVFGNPCEPYCPSDDCEFDCSYDEDWSVTFRYLESSALFELGDEVFPAKEKYDDKIWNITLTPKKPSSIKARKFRGIFSKSNAREETCFMASHTDYKECFWSENRYYKDAKGLTYAMCLNSSDNIMCVKNKLNYIRYEFAGKLKRKYLEID